MEPFETPSLKKLSLIDRYFLNVHTLKPSDAFVFKAALLVCVILLSLLVIRISTGQSVAVATAGGTLNEGIIGTPRFVNPVLAVTRADKDLTTLVYDGLMTLGADGELVPNIAESLTISEDGLTYNVILRNNVSFHDGTPLTAYDVAFTVNRIQDPLLASPLRSSFDGVRIEEVGEYEINFILPEAYAPFIQNLTFGILPQHIWKDAGDEEFPFSQYNSEPIGSGPYVVENIIRNASGIPEAYVLKSNATYHLGTPKIEHVRMQFFSTEDKLIQAFNKGLVDSVVGIDSSRFADFGLNDKTHHIERIPLPRTFALFINQNKAPALRDLSARKALDVALNRKTLVDTTLGGYGNPLTTPIPVGFGLDTDNKTPEMSGSNIDSARAILRDGGWKLNEETQIWEKDINGTLTPLSFSIATVNNSAFETAAEFLRNTWEQLGAEVVVKQFEQSDLTQAIIRPRDYETLLFGTQLGRSLDFYSFWHSSQRNDPGLNIALYANITTDSILSEMRRNTDTVGRNEAIKRFSEEISKETPAIFLYAPELLYVFPNKVHGATFKGVSEPNDRFSRIQDWYIQTESVWPFFTQ